MISLVPRRQSLSPQKGKTVRLTVLASTQQCETEDKVAFAATWSYIEQARVHTKSVFILGKPRCA